MSLFEKERRYIYYCSKCQYTGSDFANRKNKCPNCNKELTMSQITVEEWRTFDDAQKQQLKAEWSDLIKPVSSKMKDDDLIPLNDIYEYEVIKLTNVNHGSIDVKLMESTLNEHARNGWHLKAMYSNELGKNALAINGFGMNETVCEDVLIFERRVAVSKY